MVNSLSTLPDYQLREALNLGEPVRDMQFQMQVGDSAEATLSGLIDCLLEICVCMCVSPAYSQIRDDFAATALEVVKVGGI